MVSDARFGIELYEADDRDRAQSGRIGHVWSPDAELIVRDADGTVHIVDPSGANPRLVNSSIASLEGFLEAFRVFYLGDRPAVPAKMTVDEARARLAALHRGETLADPVAAAPIARPERLATLRQTLGAQDPPAVAEGTWWARILRRPEFD